MIYCIYSIKEIKSLIKTITKSLVGTITNKNEIQ